MITTVDADTTLTLIFIAGSRPFDGDTDASFVDGFRA